MGGREREFLKKICLLKNASTKVSLQFPSMSFISSDIDYVSASMEANVFVFNVILIPTVTFVTDS